MVSKEKHEQLAQKYNNEDNTKCKHCKNCKIYHEERTDNKGNKVKFTYCEGGKEVAEMTNWLYRGQGGYVGSATKIKLPNFDYSTNDDGKYHYFHQAFVENPSENCIDHINHCRTDNRLSNLFETTQAANNQNHNNGDSLTFHNVRQNNGKYKTSYTAYKKIGTKTVTIGTYSTDIKAFDAFVDYCERHELEVNPHTSAFKVYESVKSTNSTFNSGVHIIGGKYENL